MSSRRRSFKVSKPAPAAGPTPKRSPAKRAAPAHKKSTDTKAEEAS